MTPKKSKALRALICAPTIQSAAEKSGVSYSALRSWLRDDPEFKQEYEAATAQMIADAARQSSAALTLALDTLVDVAKSGENGQTRVSAARSLLEYSLRLRETADAEERMAKIEAALMEDGKFEH